MAYLLFFYNIAISFASIHLCSTYWSLYHAERQSTFFYTALLYLLYLADIIVLYMSDFIPEFEDALAWLQESASYAYPALSVAMLLCYRLILTSACGRENFRRDVAFWAACFMGTIASWAIPNFAISVSVEWAFTTVLRIWIIVFAMRMMATPEVNQNRVTLATLGALLTVFIICETADSFITLSNAQAGLYPLRRIPMEILGNLYLLTGFLYLRCRRRLASKAAEADLISIVAQRYDLTKREQEMLRMMADGMSNREISEREYISIGTVKTHAHNTYKKLGITGRTELDGFLQNELENASRPSLR